jgi:3,5-dioxohexanoate:acetyl-CoA acetone transferase
LNDYEIIITCAATGASLSPSMSSYLPFKPEDIVAQSVDAAKAGAAIIHLHARNPVDGSPTNDLAVWKQIVPEIRSRCDAIINMSASLGSSAEDRLSAVLALRPEIATVIVGSMNYGLFRKAENQGVKDFELDWEKEAFGRKSYEIVTNNNYAKIDKMMSILIAEDIGMEFECYDVGHLYVLEHHLKKHKVKKPLIVQFLTGILGGIPSEIDHLLYMKRTAERLFGKDLELFTHGTGLANIRSAVYGGMMGTHVRVGQEDNLFERPGKPFKSNAAQVSKVAGIFGQMGIGVASTESARKRLKL